uniref:Methyltransferase domain-containing protein n=1 Tax=viral metagenome TaxID=1070528 RepID=A0A6C0HAN8_9ZZZZ
MEQLVLFSAGSMNDHSHQHLWLKGASLFIPQINKLLEHTNYNFDIVDIEKFENNNSTLLGNILKKNKSDKSTGHNYHILYSFIFNKIGGDINILEIGLGTNNPHIVSSMGHGGTPGASLYSFREYLPNARIYGGDVDKDILFDSDRIKTCFVDQLDITTFENFSNIFGKIKYDLIIDDGLHSIGANLNTLLYALENINENGWIVIEDIHIINNWKSIDFILKSSNKFKTYIVKSKIAHLYVINKL